MIHAIRKHKFDRTGFYLGIAVLLIQVGLIIYARFIPERYFCWAPYDQCTQYSIEVSISGKPLEKGELWNRYRINPDDWDARSAANIISIVQRFESTLGTKDNARVTIHYTTNGHPERQWDWPERDSIND
jgi:hypothetical protein